MLESNNQARQADDINFGADSIPVTLQNCYRIPCYYRCLPCLIFLPRSLEQTLLREEPAESLVSLEVIMVVLHVRADLDLGSESPLAVAVSLPGTSLVVFVDAWGLTSGSSRSMKRPAGRGGHCLGATEQYRPVLWLL